MRKNTKPWERERWVREWRRSKLSAREFCEAHGLPQATLYMWARALRGQGERSELMPLPRLVEAVPVDGVRRNGADWSWELEGPWGVLRGRDLNTSAVAELVVAITRSVR